MGEFLQSSLTHSTTVSTYLNNPNYMVVGMMNPIQTIIKSYASQAMPDQEFLARLKKPVY